MWEIPDHADLQNDLRGGKPVVYHIGDLARDCEETGHKVYTKKEQERLRKIRQTTQQFSVNGKAHLVQEKSKKFSKRSVFIYHAVPPGVKYGC